MKKYYFKEKFFKIIDKYPILDENGKKVFFFDQDLKLVGYKANLKDRDGQILFEISKKIFALFQTYYIDFYDSSKMKIKQNFSFVKRRIDAYYKGKKFKLKGSIIDHNFEVYYKNELVAKMNKKFFSLTDNYELTVYNEDLTLALIALCLCLNQMKDRDDKKDSSSSN